MVVGRVGEKPWWWWVEGEGRQSARACTQQNVSRRPACKRPLPRQKCQPPAHNRLHIVKGSLLPFPLSFVCQAYKGRQGGEENKCVKNEPCPEGKGQVLQEARVCGAVIASSLSLPPIHDLSQEAKKEIPQTKV